MRYPKEVRTIINKRRHVITAEDFCIVALWLRSRSKRTQATFCRDEQAMKFMAKVPDSIVTAGVALARKQEAQ